MKAYNECVIELVNTCNAKCKYCTTGIRNRMGNKKDLEYMSVKMLQKGIEKLFRIGAINHKTLFTLYNWSEPLLNPEINEIINFFESRKLWYSISTNASYINNFKPTSLKYLREFKISLSAFDSVNYEKIHGFQLDKVKENIMHLAEIMDELGVKEQMYIGFHLYKFSISEIEMAMSYFNNAGIRVESRFAYLADYDEMKMMLQESYEDVDFSEDLYSYDLFNRLQKLDAWKYKEQACHLQNIQIVFDENFNIVPCCVLTNHDSKYNLFDIADIEFEKKVRETYSKCQECKRMGQPFFLSVMANDIFQKLYMDIYTYSKFTDVKNDIYIYGKGVCGQLIMKYFEDNGKEACYVVSDKYFVHPEVNTISASLLKNIRKTSLIFLTVIGEDGEKIYSDLLKRGFINIMKY